MNHLCSHLSGLSLLCFSVVFPRSAQKASDWTRLAVQVSYVLTLVLDFEGLRAVLLRCSAEASQLVWIGRMREGHEWGRGLSALLCGLLIALAAIVATGKGGGGARGEGGLGGGLSVQTSLEQMPMRWSPADVTVQKPGLSVHEARATLALSQQKRWAQLFGNGDGRPMVLPPDVALAAVSASGKARLGRALKRATELAQQSRPARLQVLAANGSPSAEGWRTEEGDYANESSEDEPVDMPSRQVYEYIARPHGGRMSVDEGAREWDRLQRHYTSAQPSMSTYPAVPVVFDDDDSGGHAVNGDPIQEDEYRVSRRDGRGGGRLRGGPVELLSAGGMFPNSSPAVSLVEDKGNGGDAPTEALSTVASPKVIADGGLKMAMAHAASAKGVTLAAPAPAPAAKTNAAGYGAKRGEMTEVKAAELETIRKLQGGDAISAGGSEEHVPKSVVDKATKMIKSAVVQQLAMKDEAKEEDETDFILGGGGDTPKKSGFAALHRAVSEMLSNVEAGDKARANKDAIKAEVTAKELAKKKIQVQAEQRANAAHRREVKEEEAKDTDKLASAAIGVTAQQQAKSQSLARVRARALELVKAFDGAGL